MGAGAGVFPKLGCHRRSVRLFPVWSCIHQRGQRRSALVKSRPIRSQQSNRTQNVTALHTARHCTAQHTIPTRLTGSTTTHSHLLARSFARSFTRRSQALVVESARQPNLGLGTVRDCRSFPFTTISPRSSPNQTKSQHRHQQHHPRTALALAPALIRHQQQQLSEIASSVQLACLR